MHEAHSLVTQVADNLVEVHVADLATLPARTADADMASARLQDEKLFGIGGITPLQDALRNLDDDFLASQIDLMIAPCVFYGLNI